MKNKIVLFTIFLLVTVNILGISFVTIANAEPSVNEMALKGLEPMDLTPEQLGEDEIAIRKKAAEVGSDIATGASPVGDPATIGEHFNVSCSDDYLGVDYDQEFVVILDGTHGIIAIQKEAYDAYDAVNDEYVFPNPNGCWRPEDRISTDMFQYLLDEFDDTMYPTVTTIYGEPLARGAEGQKIWVLIFNIRDPSYYDETYTWYYAGYFSASTSSEQNKNIMHIDSYDWQNRVGPGVDRPYLYEGVFAHEFEHLVHFDIDPDEPSWVDEGLADLAGFFCEYGHSDGHLFNYLVYHPMTSLTFWGSGLEDYGASYLFQLYLFEHYGGAEFTSALVQEQANGIEGIENTLAAFGYSETFNEIFDDWTIANYIDDTRKAGSKYGYETLDIGSADTRGATIEWALNNVWWGPPEESPFGVPSGWFYGIEPQPYTAHYFRFNNDKKATIEIDGDDFSGVTAYSGTYEWYSDAAAWAWRSFYRTFDLSSVSTATLNFMTFFEIEGDWDYGYVEVFEHDGNGGGEWYTLDAPGTLNYVGHPQDNPDCPDHREPTAYEAAGRWHAFSGDSGGWMPVSMDLTPFAGKTIDLYFTTWQDGAFTLQMMYVDDISITEIGFFDDVEAGPGMWGTTSWYITDGIQENGLGVTLIDTKGVPTARYPEPAENNAMTLHRVSVMTTDPSTQYGTMGVPATPVKSGRVAVAIVSNHAGHILSSHYDLWVLW